MPCFQRQAQHRGRRFAAGLGRAEREREARAILRRHGKPAQLRIAGAGQPEQQGVEGPGAQRLLRRPQGVAPPGCAHHRQALEADARGAQRRRVRQVRGRQPGDAAPGRGQRREGGKDDLQLTDALVRAQHLGKAPGRPTASGQLGVQRREAGRRGRRAGIAGGGDSGAAPDGLPLEDFREGNHGYCI